MTISLKNSVQQCCSAPGQPQGSSPTPSNPDPGLGGGAGGLWTPGLLAVKIAGVDMAQEQELELEQGKVQEQEIGHGEVEVTTSIFQKIAR